MNSKYNLTTGWEKFLHIGPLKNGCQEEGRREIVGRKGSRRRVGGRMSRRKRRVGWRRSRRKGKRRV